VGEFKMRKERLALVEGVTEQLHNVEEAMDRLMTEHAKLGVSILHARTQARMGPLVGQEVLSKHATGQLELSQFMGSMVQFHTGLRDLAREAMPGVAIGDTPVRPSFHLAQGEEASPLRVVRG
jgi:hypothetical protein